MAYKVTGRPIDVNKLPIVKEELRYNEDEPEPPKAKVEKENKDDANALYRFFIESKELGPYTEKGFTKYFPSKSSAKRIRNVLNKKYGSGSYLIKKVSIEEMMMGIPFMM